MLARVCWIVLAGIAPLLIAPATAAPVPAPNARYEPPTIVFQARNGQKILDDFRAYLKLNGGGEEMQKKVDAMLKEALGEKGFEGLDLARPMGGYAYVRGKFETSHMVLVLPITTEKDALGFLERLHLGTQDSKIKGIYELTGGPFPREMKGHLRFHDKHAYLSIHGPEIEARDALDALADSEKLIPISRLVDDKDTALFAATLTVKRFPKELADMAHPLFDELNGDVDRMQARAPNGMPKSAPAFLKEMLGWGRRSYDLMLADGETLSLRLTYDAKSSDLDIESTLTPKAKSALAADLAAIAPAKGRFHQLVTKDAVSGGWFIMPGGIPKGVLMTFGSLIGEWVPIVGRDSGLPAEFTPLFDSMGTVFQKAITSGEVDLGAAVFGPTKAGHYTAVGALGLDDPTTFLKIVLAVAKDLPKDFAEAIKLNAYKIGDVSVHTLTLDKLIPEDILKIFGEKPALNIAVGNKGLFLAVGPNAAAEIKRAMALKPAEATVFDVVANLAKWKDLIKAAGGNLREIEAIPMPDRLMSYYGFDVRGGKDLKMRTSGGQYALMMMMMSFGAH